MKMRDPKRIDIIFNQIATIWKANPDMRFGQMIYGSMTNIENLFDIEDSELLDRIELIFGNHGQ